MITDEELRNLYKISGEEHLQKMEALLLHLQTSPNDETWEELRQEVHSLKGDSRSLGVEPVEILSNQVEEIILFVKNNQIAFTEYVGDRLFQGLNAMNRLIQEAVTGNPSGIETSQIIDNLMEVFLPPTQQGQEVAVSDYTVELLPSLIEDEELRNLYKISSLEHLQKIEVLLLHLNEQPGEETWEELRREVHSLKGDSRSLGVETVEILSNQVEEIVLGIQRKQITLTEDVSTRLLQGLDAMSRLVQEAVTGKPSGVEILKTLDTLAEVFLLSTQPQPEIPVKGNIQIVPILIEDEELRNAYQISSFERLQKLEASLLQIEKNPFDTATLEQMLRGVHSLKGDSRSVGVETVEVLSHEIEEILLGVKRKQIALTPSVSDRLLQGLDAMGRLIQEATTGKPSGVDTVQILDSLMETVWIPPVEEFQSFFEPPQPVEVAKLPSSSEVNETHRIDTIRVETRHLDALMAQAEELTVTKIAIAHATAQIEEMLTLWEEWKASLSKGRSVDSPFNRANPYQERLEKIINSVWTSTQENSSRLEIVTGELREKIRTLRLLPLSNVFQLYHRVVRDLAKQQSKQVELIIEGGETTADKRLIEEIQDSLMHMVRNAIDHGIETPAEREQLGKPPIATIWLRGYQTANNIVIEVADDGRGLDIEKIKQTALEREICTKEALATMTSNQIYALILAPGFSTRSLITEISGRGIGLDVVRTNVERLKGNIHIESTPGRGCLFRIQLSTTLTTVHALLLEIQGVVYALPIEFVLTTLLVLPEQISTIEDKAYIIFEDQSISVANLADVLESNQADAKTSVAEQPKSNLKPCILLKVGEQQAGFFVDACLDTQEIVLKPQSQLLKRVRNVSGATILPTGEVCMILNPSDLLKSLQKQSISVSIKPKERKKPVILLVEDSIPVRTQEKRLLENAGYEVVLAVDGLDGYNKLRTRDFDAVISDVEMPNLDGFALTAKIRQYQEYSKLPIILVTTLAGDEDKQKGIAAGADAYIIKGKFNQSILLETLEKLVELLNVY
ncbi:Hpt domain-containing protein [Iningainema sp. BLCCT55]|uniref:histidine kinase n=2 Tax=Iningainema TaxID=1932705 RepID=A0A8J7C7Q5_9CYAN|nr:Hpt domain-containing protein [Iningainema tapete BLCC-T55]